MDNNLIKLSRLVKELRQLMKSEVLSELAKFLEVISDGQDTSLVEKYDWFCHNSENGSDCRYAKMSREIFLNQYAKKTADTVNWLYHNWSSKYE